MDPPVSVPTPHRLLELVEAMQGKPVLMLVDLVVDRFITGTPKRISREAPVLILSHTDESTVPGGGANAVANVRALGGEPRAVGVVGDDAMGQALRRHLAERGINGRGILTRPGYFTPTKTRILGGGKSSIKQQIVRIDREERLILRAEERQEILDRLQELHGDARVLVLSDYGYGTVDPELVAEIGRRLGEGLDIVGDSRHRLHEFQGLAAATPNEEEAETLTKLPLSDPRAIARGGARLLQQLGVPWLLTTLGSRGMALSSPQGTALLPVHGANQVADVTGAGDTVISTFALARAAGAHPLEAALLANYAGGVVVMKVGTATLSARELEAAIQSDPGLGETIEWVSS